MIVPAGRHFTHVFAFVPGDLQNAQVLGFGSNPTEEVNRQFAQHVQGIRAFPRQHLGQLGLERIEDPLDHGIEKVGLVLEVPVDGSTGHSGGGGDLGQRGPAHAALLEDALRGIEDGVAGLQRLFLGLSHHASPLPENFGAIVAPLYIHARMYV